MLQARIKPYTRWIVIATGTALVIGAISVTHSRAVGSISIADMTTEVVHGGFSKVALTIDGTSKGDKRYAYLRFDIDIEPGWKTYWKYPGETGFPPAVTITAAKFEDAATELLLPPPARIAYENSTSTSIGYNADVSLLQPIALWRLKQSSFRGGNAVVEITYAVCREICAPETAKWNVRLPSPHDWLAATVSQETKDALRKSVRVPDSYAPRIHDTVKVFDKDGDLLKTINARNRVEVRQGNSASAETSEKKTIGWMEFIVTGLTDAKSADVFVEGDRSRLLKGGTTTIVSRDHRQGRIVARVGIRHSDNIDAIKATIVDGNMKQSWDWLIEPATTMVSDKISP